ncbi:hypothetical protein [Streptomyces rochei]|uniref:hypothetical protein n=1 Tax=Streptomyces rochei TaxID=1928 RepID=UPI0036CA4D96
MPKDLKLNDFDQMLTASTAIANETFDVSTDKIVVQIEDEDGELYVIEDVKYNPMTGGIHLKFNHDNDD